MIPWYRQDVYIEDRSLWTAEDIWIEERRQFTAMLFGRPWPIWRIKLQFALRNADPGASPAQVPGSTYHPAVK